MDSVAENNGDNSSDAECAVVSISVEITTTEYGHTFAESKRKNINRNNSTRNAADLKQSNSYGSDSACNFTESQQENSDGNYSEQDIAESKLSNLDGKYSAKGFTESRHDKEDGNYSDFSVEITTNSQASFNDESENISENPESISGRNQKDYKCRICDKIFDRRIDMHVHRLTHFKKERGDKNDVSRPNIEAGDSQKNSGDVIDGMILEHRANRLEFQCFECERTFWTVAQFEEHQKIHCEQTGLVHRCKFCESGFFTEEDLDLHELIHTNKQLLKCSDCGCEFQKSFCDENDDSFKCEKCGVKSPRKDCQPHRSGDKPFECKICGNSFTRRGNLQRHELIHSSQKPYKCHCGKAFTQPGHLKVHEMSHQSPELIHTKLKETKRSEFVQNRTFSCSTCGTSFSRRGNLQRHELIHTAQKPYKCHCGKAFTQPSHLKAHEMTHTKERPFECAECGMTFTRKGNLKRHVQLHEEKNRSMQKMYTHAIASVD